MRTMMKRLLETTVTMVVVAMVAAPVAAGDDELVERGRYLISLGGCHDCHSPKIFTEDGFYPDPERLLSGHPADLPLPEYDPAMVAPGKWVLFNSHFTAAVGPWGTTRAANLTPDDQTGIGLWSLEHFAGALKTGKHMGEGRPILPPMPWPNLTALEDEDYAAMFAYLKSLEPIRNPVPAPVPPVQTGSR